MGPSSLCSSIASPTHFLIQRNHNPLNAFVFSSNQHRFSTKTLTTNASLSSTIKESVLKDFHQGRALKIISGLNNFDRDNVASVVIAAEKGGATHVDIACDPELVKLAVNLTSLPICVSSIDPNTFPAAVEAGALMVEIGNYDSFYDMGILFSPKQILRLAKETKRILPSVALSVTVPHTLSLPDQVTLAEMLEEEGVDIIQTEGGKCSNPSNSGVLGLIEKCRFKIFTLTSSEKTWQVGWCCRFHKYVWEKWQVSCCSRFHKYVWKKWQVGMPPISQGICEALKCSTAAKEWYDRSFISFRGSFNYLSVRE